MNDETARNADRIEAARWLADRGFGKAVQSPEVEVAPRESEELQIFAAVAAKYVPDELFDELVATVEARITANQALPAGPQP